jgi:pyruvate dehydrogenase E1 component alpha subunit
MPGELVDGFDFFAVHEAMGRAAARARSGQGPFLLHIRTGRFFGHHEGDSQTYRAPGEAAALRRDHDCLKLFRGRVTQAGLLDAGAFDALDHAAETLVDDAVAAAEAAPLPPTSGVLDDVYVSY